MQFMEICFDRFAFMLETLIFSKQMWIQYVNILRYPKELGISCLFLNVSENHCTSVWLQNPLWVLCQKDANRYITKDKVSRQDHWEDPSTAATNAPIFLNYLPYSLNVILRIFASMYYSIMTSGKLAIYL